MNVWQLYLLVNITICIQSWISGSFMFPDAFRADFVQLAQLGNMFVYGLYLQQLCQEVKWRGPDETNIWHWLLSHLAHIRVWSYGSRMVWQIRATRSYVSARTKIRRGPDMDTRCRYTGPVEPFTLKHLDVDPCCWTDEGPAYCCITSPRPRDIWTLDEAPVRAGLDGFGRSCLKPWFHYLFNCIYLLVWRFQIWKHFSFALEPKWHGQNETEGELVDFHTGVVQFSTWADN